MLAEAHNGRELELALELERAIVGVNSRDLKTLETDLEAAAVLAPEIPAGRLSIAESGIKTRGDIEKLEGLGYDGFLVGEALMSEDDPDAKLKGLL